MEFKESKINDIATLVTDYVANGSFKSLKDNVATYDTEEYSILIRLVDYNNKFKGPFKYTDKHGHDFLKKTKLLGDEIIISNVGANAGTVFKVPTLDKAMNLGPNSLLVKFDGDNDYFYYYFLSDLGQNQLKSILSGSAQPKFNKTDFKNLSIRFPSEENQKKISSRLALIDNKIEINNDLIENLEELSQTLFKRWFVDFEFPDENGNPYKTSGGKFVNSEVGQIPIGWEIRELNDLVKNKKDTFNPKNFSENQVVHFSLPAYDNGEIPILENVTDIKSNKWYIDDNCVLFSKMNPRTMRVWLTDVSTDFLNVCSTEFVVLKSDSKKQNAFIYNICKSSNFADYLQSNATGSTNSRQRIRPSVALEYKLAISDATMIHLGELLEPYTNMISILRREIVSLIDLRDTLLPKLMSGEIELPDDLEVDEHAELL